MDHAVVGAVVGAKLLKVLGVVGVGVGVEVGFERIAFTAIPLARTLPHSHRFPALSNPFHPHLIQSHLLL